MGRHSIYAIAVALVFTVVPHIFTRGGREVGASGKHKVLLQPDGSIVSGGTVVKDKNYTQLLEILRKFTKKVLNMVLIISRDPVSFKHDDKLLETCKIIAAY